MSRQIVRTLSKHAELGTLVQLVEDSTNGRQYVIKRIMNLETPIFKTIFQKETQALMRLKACRNIVRIFNSEIKEHDDGKSEGIISMEYIPGRQLSQIVESIPNTSTRYKLVRQLTNAIRFAHTNSVIHRDINPSNILITDDFDLKLIDFGIAKIRGMMQTGTTYQFATHNYSAPEVTIHSENASERSDIYSLGAVIYFLFTGIAPSRASEFESAISRSCGIDVTLKEVISKMCAPNPSDRYENIDDCELALMSLYQRYCGTDEHYYFSVPMFCIDQLKNKNLVNRGRNIGDILNVFLPSQFEGGYVNSPSNDSGIYRFDGISICMDCTEENGILQVTNFERLDAFKREQRKKYSLELPGKFCFIQTHLLKSTALRNNCDLVLCNRIDDFQQDIISQKYRSRV